MKEIQQTLYQCEICEKTFTTEQKAQECEKDIIVNAILSILMIDPKGCLKGNASVLVKWNKL